MKMRRLVKETTWLFYATVSGLRNALEFGEDETKL